MRKWSWSIISSLKIVFHWLLYFVFMLYMGKLIFSASDYKLKLFYSIIGIAVLGITLYYDYLKKLYRDMIEALTVDTNIELAKSRQKKLRQRDLFNGFKHSLILFDSLLLLDEKRYRDCLAHMDTHQTFFRSTVDNLFIYYHNQLHCHYFLGDTAAGKEAAAHLKDIKKLKQKAYSPLFSWDEIAGVAYALDNRYSRSVKAFKKVDTTRLNNREKSYLNTMLADSYRALNDSLNAAKHSALAQKTLIN